MRFQCTGTESGFGISEKIAQLECPSFRKQLRLLYQDVGMTDCGLDLGRVVHRLGVTVIIDPLLPATGQISVNSRGETLIHLRYEPKDGQHRFTFAHELAHEIIHRERLELAGPNCDRFAMKDVEEDFCDFVAGLLLMPLPIFFFRLSSLASQFPRINEWSYSQLAREFRVSIKSLLVQITLMRSFRFIHETYVYGPLAPSLEQIEEQPADSCMYSGRWNLPRQLVEDYGSVSHSVTKHLGRELPAKAAEMLAAGAAPTPRYVEIDNRFRDSTTDWSGDTAVIKLERVGQYEELRHILRPTTCQPFTRSRGRPRAA